VPTSFRALSRTSNGSLRYLRRPSFEISAATGFDPA
jgi:hypothetical protein